MDAGKKSFLWLVGVFVAPILLGTLLFFNLDNLGFNRGSTNYGTLVQPAFPLKIEGLMQSGGNADIKETLSKKWTILYIESGECKEACLNRLKLIKRIRLLTNEQMRRVRTTVVSSKDTLAGIDKGQNSDLVMAHLEASSSSFYNQFPAKEKSPIYLIDPLGNLMMYYPQVEPDVKKMLKDINRLLKYSHLG